jgi:phage shock protein PspC (stress-responsive transcriptional regulator)
MVGPRPRDDDGAMTENTDSGEQPAASGASEGGPQPGPQAASQTFTAAPPPPQQPPHRPRPPLRRSREDRKLAGVSGGLGRYFDVDPLIFRVLFVTLAVFGGSGLLLYAIAWLFIPDEGENESELQSLVNGRGSSRIVGAIVLGVLGLIALGNFAHTGWGFGGFAALVAIGLAVYLITRGDNAWRAAPQSPAPPATTSRRRS